MPDSLFLWGLLGLVQIVFLPGYLLARAMRLRLGVIDAFLLSFGFGTVLNYFLVQSLVFFHVFTRPVVLGIIFAEVVLLIWLRRRGGSCDRWQLSAEIYQGALVSWTKLATPEKTVAGGFALLAVYCIFAFVHSATASWPDEAFTLWDNVMSWNRWATEWAANKPPWKTYHYPQLLPANSSIIYVLSDTTDVQAFNRLFFAFFPVAIFACLFDLGLRCRQIGYWLGIPLIYFAWLFMGRPGPAEGYADVPVTFMILMALYSMFIADGEREPGHVVRWMITAGVFTGAAALTKQTGLILILSLPALLFLLVDRPKVRLGSQKGKAILWALATALLLSIPWYVVKHVQIQSGVDQSEIAPVANAHGGRSPAERIIYGIQQMFLCWGVVQTVAVAALAVLSGFLRISWRWAVWLIVLPGFFIWALTTSYDLRNSNFFVILGCISAGVGLGWLVSQGAGLGRKWPVTLRSASIVFLAVLFAWGLSTLPTVSNPNLARRSNLTQKTTAMPELNAEIFRLIAEGRMTRPVITNYWMMHFIPGLKEFMTYDSFSDVAAFNALLAKGNPEYLVVLHPSQNYPAVSDLVVAANVRSGVWSVEKTGGAFQILRIHSVSSTGSVTAATSPPASAPQLDRNVRFGYFKVTEGLAPEEGPYPQWNLPLVRWGLGPATKLEFHAKPAEAFELTLEIERPATKLTIEIVLNGLSLARAEIAMQPENKTLVFPLEGRSGINQLEIRYSAWDNATESRPLAVLFRSVKLVPR